MVQCLFPTLDSTIKWTLASLIFGPLRFEVYIHLWKSDDDIIFVKFLIDNLTYVTLYLAYSEGVLAEEEDLEI